MADSAVIGALRALRSGDREAAGELCRDDQSTLVARALSSYLASDEGGEDVYDQPEAFQAFITGGGNVSLYDAASRALAEVYESVDSAASVLDIGCGDGAALVPALSRTQNLPAHVDLVETSQVLLSIAKTQLEQLGVTTNNYSMTAQHFVSGLDRTRRWDVVESTFALHAIPPDERSIMLRQLHTHVGKLAIIEFDVPVHEPMSDAHLAFLADTYEVGLGEYGNDRDLVAQGFLMPVLVGQLTPGAPRVTFEQPAEAWGDQLEASGYREVTYQELCPYWSSPAVLITARGRAA